ncbi:MAG: squalene--hopene cyclase [Verrucomicrobiaceae bacterium]|nr:squalene--hopene cyclase [Verrucomicrobiaceae bacterium]
MKLPAILLQLLFLFQMASSGLAQGPVLRFGGEVPPEVDMIYDRGLQWLASKQDTNGHWQDGYSGAGVDGLCLMVFLASGEDPNYGKYAGNIRRGLRALIQSQEGTSGYLPNSMYHHGFGMLALAEAYGVVDESLLWDGSSGNKVRGIGEALDLAVRCAVTSAKRNPLKAWRYSPDASDADTSVAGAVLMGLLAARNAGMAVPDETIDGGLEYMRRSTSKSGYVAYSGGFGGMGESMARSSIAALVFAVSKHKDWEEYAATLKHIMTDLEHREGGHPEYYRYYAAQALFQGDYEAWQKWNAATIRSLKETQAPDGSFSNGSYQTAMSLLALALNYRFLPVYER